MRRTEFVVAMFIAFCATRADAQTFTTLIAFTGAGGSASGNYPTGSLTLSGTTLYGMTSLGGAIRDGNIFSVGSNGTNYQNLVSFTGTSGTASGLSPFGSLIVSGTRLCGMTYYGGANQLGNIFSVGTDGTNYQNLVTFGGTASGGNPGGSLTVADTTFYGMTGVGSADGHGNIFSVGSNGTSYGNLASFTGTGGTAIGASPNGSLALGGTTLYGMTEVGGTNGYGSVFSIGIDGTNYQNLVSFSGSSGAAIGAFPHGALLISGTTLYGMTAGWRPYGSGDGYGSIFSVGIDGSDFDDLYGFTGGADGGGPAGDLTLSDGTLFGMTSSYGANGHGTVFALVLPEPSTLSLAGAATLASIGYRWQKKRPHWKRRR